MDNNLKIDDYFEYEKRNFSMGDFVGMPTNDQTTIESDDKIFAGKKAIASRQFSGYKGFSKAHLPENIKYVGQSAFSSTRLVEFSAEEGLEIVGRYAFADCSYMVRASLPNSLTILDKHAFKNCYCLDKIVIPPSVLSLPSKTDCPFLGCINLRCITCHYTLADTIKSYSEVLPLLSKVCLTNDEGKVFKVLQLAVTTKASSNGGYQKKFREYSSAADKNNLIY